MTDKLYYYKIYQPKYQYKLKNVGKNLVCYL